MGAEQIGDIWIQPRDYGEEIDVKAIVLARLAVIQKEFDGITGVIGDNDRCPALLRFGQAYDPDDGSVDFAQGEWKELIAGTNPDAIAEAIRDVLVTRTARDLFYREFPGDRSRIICFAGEMSWGDPPDGAAYTALQLIGALDLTQALRIE